MSFLPSWRWPTGLVLLLPLLLLSTVAVRSQAEAPRIGWSTTDAGGLRASGGPFVLYGTVGQPDSGRASAGELQWVGGFWPGLVEALPSMTPSPTTGPPTVVAPASPTTVVRPTATPPTVQPTAGPPTVAPPDPSPSATTPIEPTALPPSAVPPTVAPSPTPRPLGRVEVGITAAAHFVPDPIRVRVGDRVRWTNHGTVPHSSTSGEAGDPDGAWSSGFLDPEESFTYTFDAPGVYRYHCLVHPDAGHGTVYVGEVGAVPGGPVIFLPRADS